MPEPASVVVVESPAKAKTINKYLGRDFIVLASYGHVRDLPPKDGSVDPEADFKMIWEVDARAQKRLKDIADAVKSADRLILATDPDREGEAISWHVLEALRQRRALGKTEVQRVVFNAITKSAVLEAMANPRESTRRWSTPIWRAGPDYSSAHALAGLVAEMPGAARPSAFNGGAATGVRAESRSGVQGRILSVEADFGAAAGNYRELYGTARSGKCRGPRSAAVQP